MDFKKLGKKIVIVGVSAAGKSAIARKLAAKTGLPAIFMDALMYTPGWNYIGDEATAKILDEESRQAEWIIEGYVTTQARTFLFERADTIIYLNYSPYVAALRYLKRSWQHREDPRPELEGSPDTFKFKTLKLIWTKGEAITLDIFLSEVKDQSKIVTLTSPEETRKFLLEA